MDNVKKLLLKYKLIPVLYLKTYLLVGIGDLIGLIIVNFIIHNLLKLAIPAFAASDGWVTTKMYLAKIGMWICLILYLKVMKKESKIIDTFTTKLRGNNIFTFIIGVALGFAMNFACAYLAIRNGDIQLSFAGVEIGSAIMIFIAILIQAGSEEIVCRGFLYQRLLQKYKKPWIAIVFNSLLFSLLHLMNPGVTVISLLSIFFAGLLPSLVMYYFDSMWLCIGEHLMWNYTQNIILGLPNSGLTVPYSMYKLDLSTAKNSFFYNVGFGIEGSWIAVIIPASVCLLIYLVMKNKHQENYNCWDQVEGDLYASEPFFNLADSEEARAKEKAKFNQRMEAAYQKKVEKSEKKNQEVHPDSILDEMYKECQDSNRSFDIMMYIIPLPFSIACGFLMNDSDGFNIVTCIVMLVIETALFWVMRKGVREMNNDGMKWIDEKRMEILDKKAIEEEQIKDE